MRRLTFSDNEIQRILPEIGQLVNLEELDCSRNDIADIPDNIRHCRVLQCLDCSGNPLANKYKEKQREKKTNNERNLFLSDW